jgi:hypothetical protein
MNAPFRQALRRASIFCDSFHYGQCEIEQFTRAKDVGRRISNQGTVVPSFGEKTVQQSLRKNDLANAGETPALEVSNSCMPRHTRRPSSKNGT